MIDSLESRSRSATIYVVDDDDGLREATCYNLCAAGYEAFGFRSGSAFLDMADLHGGGCVVLDINMPDMSGFDVQKRLNELESNISIVMVTGYGDVPMAVQAVRAGAVDFIQKPYRAQVLFDAIDRALGERRRAPSPTSADADKAKLALAALTPRERDVLQGLVAGNVNREIAAKLGLSTRTVEMHRANMMQRLGVSSLSEALRIAYDAGFAQDRRKTANLPRVGGQRSSDR